MIFESVNDENILAPCEDEEYRWAVFKEEDGKTRYLGQINKIQAPRVPDCCHLELSCPRSSPLYLTSTGYWAESIELAADMLLVEPRNEFVVTGAILHLFLSPEEARCSNDWSDYRVFKDSGGFWNAEEIN